MGQPGLREMLFQYDGANWWSVQDISPHLPIPVECPGFFIFYNSFMEIYSHMEQFTHLKYMIQSSHCGLVVNELD